MKSPWKSLFPSLNKANTHYLDSAATTQVPQIVIDAISQYLSNGSGNPGRGSYSQSELATLAIKECREKVANFINSNSEQIIFTKGTTESINLVANSFSQHLTSKDSILVTQLEHHANLLPWQKLCQQTGAKLNILPIKSNGELDLSDYQNLLNDNCKLLALTHCSNVVGFTNSISQMIALAKEAGVVSLIDGAQAISHISVDMQEYDCDFYAFSGHKIYASGGSGVLYAKHPESLSPLLLGGGIVKRVNSNDYSLLNGNQKLEAGSSNMVALTGLSSAIDFIQSIGMAKITAYEKELTKKLYQAIDELDNYTIISHPDSASIVSFYHKSIHCHDVASILAESGISIRAGHHCAQPCVTALGIKHCLRASVGLYNDSGDIDALIESLVNADKTF
ncbi:MAG: cysteine desulfurase CsdA [Kangiella sp.]|nr:MAG: cysteine desulfurase CsdA [Kangiella sp.]